MLSCDSILKCDWYCQLSGSGSKQFELTEVARLFLLQPGNKAGPLFPDPRNVEGGSGR